MTTAEKLTKRKLHEASYQKIFKEGKSYSETFEELRPQKEKKTSLEQLAEIVSSTCSPANFQKTKTLRSVLIAAFILQFSIKILSTIGLLSNSKNLILIGVAVVFSILIPGVGIHHTLKGKHQELKPFALFLGLSLLRTITQDGFLSEPLNLILLTPVALIIVLIFVVAKKTKTTYKKSFITQETEGKTKKIIHFKFVETKSKLDGILDN